LGQALIALAQTISKAILPELVHARDDALDIARRMANIAAIAGVAAVVTAILFGREGLDLIAGDDFRRFYWVMIILSIAGAVELSARALNRCWYRQARRTSPSSCEPCRPCLRWCCWKPPSTGTARRAQPLRSWGRARLRWSGSSSRS
jgi:hypothetical protein